MFTIKSCWWTLIRFFFKCKTNCSNWMARRFSRIALTLILAGRVTKYLKYHKHFPLYLGWRGFHHCIYYIVQYFENSLKISSKLLKWFCITLHLYVFGDKQNKKEIIKSTKALQTLRVTQAKTCSSCSFSFSLTERLK